MRTDTTRRSGATEEPLLEEGTDAQDVRRDDGEADDDQSEDDRQHHLREKLVFSGVIHDLDGECRRRFSGKARRRLIRLQKLFLKCDFTRNRVLSGK